MSVKILYLARPKPNGSYWYFRRYDAVVKAHLGLKGDLFRKSLGTKDYSEAVRRHAKLHAEIEREWNAIKATSGSKETATARNLDNASKAILEACGLAPGEGLSKDWALEDFEAFLSEKYGQTAYQEARYGDPDTYHEDRPEDVLRRMEKFLTPADFAALLRLTTVANNCPEVPYLSEALDLYLSQHIKGSQKHFAHGVRNAISYVVKANDNRRLSDYTRQHAIATRNLMLSEGLKTTSVRRLFNNINSVFNGALQEHGLDLKNHFSAIKIPNLGRDSKKREGFTPHERRALVVACREVADDRRFIIAMIADTGARLSEIVGLRVADVFLSAPIPHIHIRPYEEHDLKTSYSDRIVPLVGDALWAASKATEGKSSSGLLFPTYGPTKSNSASAALNKWVKEHLNIPKTVHCLRHSMKTRLIEAGIPEDIQLRLGGWTEGERKTSRGYGSYPLALLRDHLQKVVD